MIRSLRPTRPGARLSRTLVHILWVAMVLVATIAPAEAARGAAERLRIHERDGERVTEILSLERPLALLVQGRSSGELKAPERIGYGGDPAVGRLELRQVRSSRGAPPVVTATASPFHHRLYILHCLLLI